MSLCLIPFIHVHFARELINLFPSIFNPRPIFSNPSFDKQLQHYIISSNIGIIWITIIPLCHDLILFRFCSSVKNLIFIPSLYHFTLLHHYFYSTVEFSNFHFCNETLWNFDTSFSQNRYIIIIARKNKKRKKILSFQRTSFHDKYSRSTIGLEHSSTVSLFSCRIVEQTEERVSGREESRSKGTRWKLGKNRR